MNRKARTLNLLTGRNISSGMIIDQALIDLLIEKGVFTKEEIQARIEELRQEMAKRDPHCSTNSEAVMHSVKRTFKARDIDVSPKNRDGEIEIWPGTQKLELLYEQGSIYQE